MAVIALEWKFTIMLVLLVVLGTFLISVMVIYEIKKANTRICGLFLIMFNKMGYFQNITTPIQYRSRRLEQENERKNCGC